MTSLRVFQKDGSSHAGNRVAKQFRYRYHQGTGMLFWIYALPEGKRMLIRTRNKEAVSAWLGTGVLR